MVTKLAKRMRIGAQYFLHKTVLTGGPLEIAL